MNVFLNVPIKKPYVLVTFGDKSYQTSTSEIPEGKWNEGFEFQITYHAQLFDTIQLDLYDESYILLPDKHMGRAEIRLKHLEGMPHVFTNYYEIWDKKQASSNVSVVGQKRNLASNIGAIQCRIYYRYQDTNTDDGSTNEIIENILSECDDDTATGERQRRRASINSTSLAAKSTALLTDQQIGDEFRKHLQSERKSSSDGIHFQKYEEDHAIDKNDMSTHEEADDQKSWLSHWFNIGSIIPSASSSSSTTSTSNNTASLDDTSNSSLLESIGSWATSKETNGVLKTISKILAAFVSRLVWTKVNRVCLLTDDLFRAKGLSYPIIRL